MKKFRTLSEAQNKMQRDAAINEICTVVMKKHRAAMESYRDKLRSSKDDIILKDYLKYVFKPEFLK